MSILEVRGLSVEFQTRTGKVEVLRSVDLDVEEGENLAVVGETGCGKTVLARAIMRLLPRTAEVRGSIMWKGTELTALSEAEMRTLRGLEIAMLMQNPSSALDPTMRIVRQVSEPYRLRLSMLNKEAEEKARDALVNVGLPPEKAGAYPHELSGGMRQRVAIAIALSLGPTLLLADEPTKGLDPGSKDRTMEILRSVLQGDRSGIIITHDLDVAKALSSRMAVMFGGRVVECGRTKDLLGRPEHPYTADLVSSTPEKGFGRDRDLNRPAPLRGCCYSHRCEHAHDRCAEEPPPVRLSEERTCYCWLKVRD